MKIQDFARKFWVEIGTTPALMLCTYELLEATTAKDDRQFMLWAFVFSMIMIGWLTVSLARRIRQVERNQSWLYTQLKKLNPQPTQIAATHWPWGSHHTEQLGHLEAAARQFWVLYDPTDPTTAPTNEMVADWLRSERNVTKEKAQAIASILRADGLRPGRRT